ncbi:MAG: hypothetical protein K0U38_01445 [Epsilonproteobacteria bacterium]|nr:hypothetical protein [Campylobacterota bacterium]
MKELKEKMDWRERFKGYYFPGEPGNLNADWYQADKALIYLIEQLLLERDKEVIKLIESEIEKTWDVDGYNAVAGAGARRKLKDLLKTLKKE